jgi:hypothetical protein
MVRALSTVLGRKESKFPVLLTGVVIIVGAAANPTLFFPREAREDPSVKE